MGEIIFVKYYEDTDNKDTEWTYTLPNFKSITYDMNTPVSPMPMPEEDASENILVKIEGNSSKLTVNWVIKDMGTVTTVTKTAKPTNEVPIPTPTNYSASSTIRDQIEWFKEEFRPSSVSSAYELIVRLDPADITKDIVFPGTFSGFNFSMQSPSILTFNASAKFMEGSVATLYEVDTSSAPLNLILTTPTAGQINASWTAPSDPGASAISQYRVSYRKWNAGQGWSSASTSNATPSLVDISGSANLSTGTYEVYVEAFTTGLGLGRSSFTEHISVTGV